MAETRDLVSKRWRARTNSGEYAHHTHTLKQVKNNEQNTAVVHGWHTSLIIALERLRQEDPEFQVNLSSIGRFSQTITKAFKSSNEIKSLREGIGGRKRLIS